MNNINRLSIKTTGNQIDNLNDIIEALKSVEIDEDIYAYLASLLNYLKNSTYENRQELIELLTTLVVDYQAKQEELNNQESLHRMQEYNNDLKKINIITTSKYDNDSKKDMEYITFTTEDGKVEMLACESTKALSNFIKDHAEDVATKSAEDIFRYFKENVHRDIRFMKPEEMETDYQEISQTAIMNDEHIKGKELNKVEEYKEKFGITDDIEVGIDYEGERFYRLGDGILKFKDTVEGRVMVIIQPPTLQKEEEYQAVIEEEPIEPDVNREDNPEETPEVFDPSEISGMNLDQFRNLVYDKEINHRILSPKEERQIFMYASLLISTMVERAEATDRDYATEETLDDYMYDIVVRYESLQDGYLTASEITPQEINLAEKYLAKKEEIKALNLQPGSGKSLSLGDTGINNRKAGIMNIVIILGVAIIGIMVLTIITIVNM